VTTVSAPPTPYRLLAGVADGSRPDLDTHLRRHGPLPVEPRRAGRSRWAHEFSRTLAQAGLTGRGGAGFPTHRKIDTIRAGRRRPVVVVNAMEGEPASGKDRALALSAPHLVLDGAELVARAVGAGAVAVCVSRSDHESARSYGAAAAERAARGGQLPMEVRQPPGRYVAGEESALVHWLDGGESLPTFRPERPATLRLHGQPALVDNAETLAHAALIARHGAPWFRQVGTPDAPGTTLITVSGAVTAPGVLEVPFGLPVAATLETCGAAALGGVLLGGYGGTWLGPDRLGTALAPDALRAAGCSLGAGVVVGMPATGCGLAETARIAAWMAGESAGQCGPCAFGLPAVAADLGQLAFGRLHRREADQLWSRLGLVEGRGACAHPDGVVRLVRSALRVFGADVEHHLQGGPCDGVRTPSVMPLPNPGEVPEWR
jgi:NADH:ubiquinone oxidoreductase subunit F (NADH-binding)